MRTLITIILFWPVMAAAAPGDAIAKLTSTAGDSSAPSTPRDTAAVAITPAAQALVARNAGIPAAPKDSASLAPHDSFNVFSATVIGAGAGLSLGNVPVVSTWKKGLPSSLADLGLTSLSFAAPGDSSALAMTVKENPDMYNMTFPLSVYVCRLSPTRRIAGGASFSMQTKQYIATIIPGTDSLRHIDLRQSVGLYSLTLDFVYGAAIPTRYFSIDKMDRTDGMLGISVAPYVSLSKTSSVTAAVSDSRMTPLRDSISNRMRGFSMQGLAVAWRAGIVTLRRLSRTGGMDACLSYSGMWCTRFRNGSSRLFNRDISGKVSDPDKEVSYYSSRFEITFSLLRKL